MFLLLDDFITYLYSEKGLALATVEAYKRDILSFLLFLKEKEISEVSLLEENVLFSYFFHLKSKGYASSSYARMHFALKVFFRYLIKEKILDAKILLFLESPKVWQLIPEVLSLSEIEKLLSVIEGDNFDKKRDKAILEVLYGCGLRVSELCALNISDVEDDFLKVRGKGGKERLVPIGKKAIEAVDQYLIYGQFPAENVALFLNNRNKRVDRVWVWRLVKFYAEEAGITKSISPHTFRHTFATHLLDGGADLRFIQDMLGHTTIASTERYTHVNMTQLRESFFRHHPRL